MSDLRSFGMSLLFFRMQDTGAESTFVETPEELSTVVHLRSWFLFGSLHEMAPQEDEDSANQ